MKDKLIEGILDNFDFDKVRRVMEFLNWTWATLPEPDTVPSTYQLIKSAKKRLEQAYEYAMDNKRDGYSHSGGFKAFAEYNETTSEVDYFELEFIVSSWSEQVDDE